MKRKRENREINKNRQNPQDLFASLVYLAIFAIPLLSLPPITDGVRGGKTKASLKIELRVEFHLIKRALFDTQQLRIMARTFQIVIGKITAGGPLIFLVFCICAREVGASPDICSAEESKDGNRGRSTLTVRLKAVKGRIVVDHVRSKGSFKPSPLFQCRAGMIDSGKREAEQLKYKFENLLLREIDSRLQKQPQFYWFALTEDEKKNPPSETPEFIVLRESDGPWEQLKKQYETWNAKRPEGIQINFQLKLVLERCLTSDFPAGLNRFLGDTPIRKFDQTSDDEEMNDRLDEKLGEITFHIHDLIGDLMQERDYIINVPSPVNVPGSEFISPSKEQIADMLSPLKGKFWLGKTIQAYLKDFFAGSRSGYERAFCASGAAKFPPKQITIRQAPQITRVVFYGIEDEGQIRVALRQILTDREFENYLEKITLPQPQVIKKCPSKTSDPSDPFGPSGPSGGVKKEIKLNCLFIDYKDLAVEETLPYLNMRDTAYQQIVLSERGLVMGVNEHKPDEGSGENNREEPGDQCGDDLVRFVELQISRPDDEKKEKKDEPRTTRAPVKSPIDPSPGIIASVSDTSVISTGNEPPLEPQKEVRCLNKPCLNFIGGGVAYRPDQGVRFFALYRRQEFLNGDWSIKFGSFGGLILSGDVNWDYLFFNKLNRRLSFQIGGGTDSIAKRLFDGVETDERRTGGAFRAGLELKREPTLLSVFVGGKHETVELKQKETITAKQNLTSFQTGAIFATSSKDIRYRRTVQFEPAIRFSPGISTGQKSFSILSLSAIFHQYLPGRRDFIMGGRLESASKNTPLFEQPYFGGEDSVRGFRVDDAIGRNQWILQNEFLFPVPGLKPESTGLPATIRSQFQLAAFFDVGGIYQTTGSKPGVRYGPGVGMRFNYGVHVLKFDWAYGIGDGALGRGHGRFYFSISREIPRLIRR